MSNNTRLIVRTRPTREQSTAFLTAEQPESPFSDILLSPSAAVEMAEELILRVQSAIRPQVPWVMTDYPDRHEYFLRWSGLAGDVQLRFVVSSYGINVWLHDRHGNALQLSGITPLASWVLTRLTDRFSYGQIEVVRYDDAVTPLTFIYPLFEGVSMVWASLNTSKELGGDIAAVTNQWLRVIGGA
jgi:hypothetical protein